MQIRLTTQVTGALPVANGGTGSATAANARTALGLAIGTDVQAYNASLAAVAGGTYTGATSITTLGTIATGTWNGTAVAVANGGTGSTTAANARTALGLAIGTDVQAYDAELAALAGLTSAADKLPYFNGSGTATVADFTAAGRALLDDADASAQRTTLGLGTIATQASSSVSISGGTITGITDLAVADGGTGASDAATARTNLGLALGTDIYSKTAVDGLVQGIRTKVADLVTIADLNGVYTYSAGVITGPVNTALSTIDGVAPEVGDKVLVTQAATLARNGLYTVDALGSGASQYQLTRSTDMDVSAEFNGALVFVVDGNTKDGSRWLYSGTASPTVGTTDISFSQLSDPATEYTAGTGLSLSANQFSISAGGVGATQLAAAVAGNGLTGGGGSALAVGATDTSVTIGADGVAVNLAAGSGLDISSGLRIAAAAAGAGLTGGAGSALAVGAGTGISVGADSVGIANSGVDTLQLADNAVTAAKIPTSVAGAGIAGGGGTALSLDAVRETPSGLVNSANTSYTLTSAPSPTDSLLVFQNGLLLQGGGVDISLSGTTVTFVTAPTTGDVLTSFYTK